MDYTYPSDIIDWVYYCHTWLQMFVYLVCAVLALRAARKRADRLVYQLVSGAFFCYAIANLFIVLYVLIYRIYPYYFTAAGLAWFSIYVFFASICLYRLDGLSENQLGLVKRHRLKSHLATAAMVFPSYGLMTYLYPSYAFMDLLYVVGGYALLYVSFLLLFASAYDNIYAIIRNFQIAVILYVACDILMFLTTSAEYESWVYNMYYPFSIAQTVFPVVILVLMSKEALAEGASA